VTHLKSEANYKEGEIVLLNSTVKVKTQEILKVIGKRPNLRVQGWNRLGRTDGGSAGSSSRHINMRLGGGTGWKHNKYSIQYTILSLGPDKPK